MRTRLPVSGCLLLSAVCLSSIVFAKVSWERTYGGQGDDEGLSVQQTSDGGFIVAGYTYSFGAGAEDVYLIKTNAQGDTLWTRTYGGPHSDKGYSVQQTTDGGYIIVGTRADTFWDTYTYLIKTDAQGDTLWTRTYYGPRWNGGYSVQQTTDGGYVIAGRIDSDSIPTSEVYLIKTDAQGDTLWTGRHYIYWWVRGYSVQQTIDGGYIVACNGQSDLGLIRFDAQGKVGWAKDLNGWVNSVEQTGDGRYILTGTHWGRVYLVKTDAFGDSIWTRTYGDTNAEGEAVRKTADDGYVIAGSSGSIGAEDSDV